MCVVCEVPATDGLSKEQTVHMHVPDAAVCCQSIGVARSAFKCILVHCTVRQDCQPPLRACSEEGLENLQCVCGARSEFIDDDMQILRHLLSKHVKREGEASNVIEDEVRPLVPEFPQHEERPATYDNTP